MISVGVALVIATIVSILFMLNFALIGASYEFLLSVFSTLILLYASAFYIYTQTNGGTKR